MNEVFLVANFLVIIVVLQVICWKKDAIILQEV
jgi:hypothetical protein